MTEFLHMGGYAAYVWSAYGIAAVVLLLNALLPGRNERRVLDDVARTLAEGKPHDAAP